MDCVYPREAAERRWATRFILKGDELEEGRRKIMENNIGTLGWVSSTSGGVKIEALCNLSCLTKLFITYNNVIAAARINKFLKTEGFV